MINLGITMFLPNSNNETIGTVATIKELKASHDDYEWYPTTDKIIKAVIDDASDADRAKHANSVLDIGAGDSRVLEAFKAADGLSLMRFYGIEKAPNHVARWSGDITFIGGDFYESDIANKEVDIIFSNPAYSDYERWSTQLIKSSYATVIYLVLPKRWANSERIQAALKSRNLVADVIMTDDFLSADRKARAEVDVIRIISETFKEENYKTDYGIRDASEAKAFSFDRYRGSDPMDMWFDEAFPNLAGLDTEDDCAASQQKRDSIDDRIYQLFKTTNTIDDLVSLYQIEADEVLSNYKTLNNLDAKLFIELNINLDTIKNTLKERMSSLRAEYWSAFIRNYKPITNRLTRTYQDKIYKELIDNARNISFNAINALIITEMVIKLANQYNEDQVKDFFYDLSNPKSVTLYKSNQKVFSDQEWRYCKDPADRPSRYKLDYRIVKHRLFGLSTGYSSTYQGYEVARVLSDICIIARLVGMKIPSWCDGSEHVHSRISPGDRVTVHYHKSTQEDDLFTEHEAQELFAIKFFANGNQHLFMNKEFALRLNIYIGKLLGWVMSAEEAADEMGVKKSDKKEFYTVFDETQVKQITFSDTAVAGFLTAV